MRRNGRDPDQVWSPLLCSRTEYPNMEDGGPLNSRLCSWFRLYPATGWARTRARTRIRTGLRRPHTPHDEGCMMGGQTTGQETETYQPSTHETWYHLIFRLYKVWLRHESIQSPETLFISSQIPNQRLQFLYVSAAGRIHVWRQPEAENPHSYSLNQTNWNKLN